MKRRIFLKRSMTCGTALSLGVMMGCTKNEQPLAKRQLGSTGEKLSVIGFGGIVVMDEEQTVANEYVARAFDLGVNYFDVAPTYGDAQDRLGPALKPYRNSSFLACKTTKRDKAGAESELNDSLQKLQTDFVDLYQLHALTTIEDVETAFGPDGAMETFVKARQDGKVRFLGFSAHSEEAALLAMERFDFDTILFPINFVCWFQGQFGPKVVQKAQEKKMGILALKALALTTRSEGVENPCKKCWYIPNTDEEMQDLALRFTLSLGTTAAVPPGGPPFFWRALELAVNDLSISDEETARLKEYSQGLKPIFSVV